MKQSSGFLGTALKILIVLVLITLLGGTGWFVWGYFSNSSQSFSFRTEKAAKGPLVATISSTGTIEPEEVIDIGAQIAGQVLRFGPDLEAARKILDASTSVSGTVGRCGLDQQIQHEAQVSASLKAQGSTGALSTLSTFLMPNGRYGKTVDWCTNVEAGDILCQLDDSLYAARVKQSEATLRSAQADLVSKKASADQATREWERDRLLVPGSNISQTEFDTAKANYETTKAAIGVSEAAIGLAQAQLNEAKVNLGYTVITSPVKGVVIDRRVNVGQTVVAGLSAPSLFLLAKDLRRVQVWVSVNEADIGNIKVGQDATFTVDTYPGETYKGKVTKVRLNAMMTQNVVTYTVEVTTDNPVTEEHPNGVLMPYLTANVKFVIEKKDDAQLVPNSALRWRPPAGGLAHVHPDFRSEYEAALKRKAAPDDGGKAGPSEKERQNMATAWVEKDGFARPVKVLTGRTDNINTEIVKVLDKDENILKFDGTTPLIVGENQGGPTGTSNPFAPKMFSGKKQ
jgi:HlyD family secretion protein